MRGMRGFSLMEVLLAIALLAGGLALALATIRAVMAVGQRSEARVESNEVMRGVQDVLRARLQSALPISFAPSIDGQMPARFEGYPDRLQFVADVPGYFGRGGPYLHDVQVRRSASGNGVELVLGLVMIQGGEVVPEEPSRLPDTLATDLRSVTWRYRGLDTDSGTLGPWRDDWRWERQQQPPLWVAMQVQPLQGEPWPEWVVRVPQGSVGRGL